MGLGSFGSAAVRKSSVWGASAIGQQSKNASRCLFGAVGEVFAMRRLARIGQVGQDHADYCTKSNIKVQYITGIGRTGMYL
jgi:hypothetical protein